MLHSLHTSQKKKKTKEKLKNQSSLPFFHLFHLSNKQRFARDWQPHQECVWFPGFARFVCHENWSNDNTANRLSRSCRNSREPSTMNHACMNFICFPKSVVKFQPIHTKHMSPCPDPVKWIILHVFEYESQCVINCYFQSVSGLASFSGLIKKNQTSEGWLWLWGMPVAPSWQTSYTFITAHSANALKGCGYYF